MTRENGIQHGGSAMLADECNLSDISLLGYSPGWTKNPTTEYNINYANFTQRQFGLTNQRISAQQKTLTISRHYSTTIYMTLYERYINGQTEKVYHDIFALKQDAFLTANLPDIEKVLTETFHRVSYNLDIIYSELKNLNYLFKTEFEYNFQRPIVKPLAETEKLLTKLDAVVRPFGFVPLSLKMFYRIVGSCNFAWDYETNEDFIWQCADPIQITSLDDLVSEVADEDNLSGMAGNYKEDGYVSLQLAADYFHKDNISGGPSYSLLITEKPSIDAQFLNEEHDTSFISYLRICFDNCGFSRITNSEYDNDYQSFFGKVIPQLKPI